MNKAKLLEIDKRWLIDYLKHKNRSLKALEAFWPEGIEVIDK